MRMCHWRAKPSASVDPGGFGELAHEVADRAQVGDAGDADRVAGLVNSSSTLMNEQPSKSVAREPLAEHVEDRQQPPAPVRARAALDLGLSAIRASSAPRAGRGTPAISSSLDAKWRYSVIFATPDSATIRSTPIALVP